MSRLMRARGLIVVVLMFAAGVSNQSTAADQLQLREDGWHSWQVASVEYAESETIFVKIKSGNVTEIEFRGDGCWGRSRKDARDNAIDHGALSSDESIDWLQQFLGPRSELASVALAAISRHAGDRSLQILIGIVESDAHNDIREEAVFWMAQSESEAAFRYIDRLLMAE